MEMKKEIVGIEGMMAWDVGDGFGLPKSDLCAENPLPCSIQAQLKTTLIYSCLFFSFTLVGAGIEVVEKGAGLDILLAAVLSLQKDVV